MRKIITLIIALAICLTLTVPAFAAYNYEFESGASTLPGFGKPTSTDVLVEPDPMSENLRRNKDAALMPPPYFYGSGDIPTDPSSLFHDNTRTSGTTSSTSSVTVGYNGPTSTVSSTILPPVPDNVAASAASNAGTTTPIIPAYSAPKYNADGTIGTIYVARTNQTIKVYEGEQLNNLTKGAGHFASTSAWDGNVALCGHNRGSYPFFSFVKDLEIGDKITYTTPYGTRTYEVFNKEQISEYDYSKLAPTAGNVLTVITCIANVPELRWSAQLKEVV